MDPFSRYLLALHLAFAMPDAPPAIFTPPGVPSPSAPGAVHAAPSPNPATPAVIHAPPLAGGAGGYMVSGITEAGINGPLIEGSGTMVNVDPQGRALPGTKFYTTDGEPSKPATGHWVVLFRREIIAPSPSTINEAFPPANYYAGGRSDYEGDLEIGTQLRINYSNNYILVPSPARWVLYEDGSNTDAGSTVIAAGSGIVVFSGHTGVSYTETDTAITGGDAAAWLANPATEYIWAMQHAYNNWFFLEGDWSGQGTSPETATWNTSIYKTGTPVLTATSALTTPPVIHSPPGRTPGTPGAIHSAPARIPGNPPVITP